MAERHGGSVVVNNNRARRDERLAWASEVHRPFGKSKHAPLRGP